MALIFISLQAYHYYYYYFITTTTTAAAAAIATASKYHLLTTFDIICISIITGYISYLLCISLQ